MYCYRLCFSKEKGMRYISHLDLQRTFTRALRRGGIAVILSRGFSPQPRLVFAVPLAVGIEGKNEYLDLYLADCWKKEVLKQALQAQLPDGLAVKAIITADPLADPLSSLVEAALYRASFQGFSERCDHIPDDILQADELLVIRTGKKERRLDIRPFVYNLWLKRDGGGPELFMLLATGSKGGARPEEILSFFPAKKERIKVFRENIFIRKGKALLTPMGVTDEDYLQKLRLPYKQIDFTV